MEVYPAICRSTFDAIDAGEIVLVEDARAGLSLALRVKDERAVDWHAVRIPHTSSFIGDFLPVYSMNPSPRLVLNIAVRRPPNSVQAGDIGMLKGGLAIFVDSGAGLWVTLDGKRLLERREAQVSTLFPSWHIEVPGPQAVILHLQGD